MSPDELRALIAANEVARKERLRVRLGLRATKVPSGKTYRRKSKHVKGAFDER